MKLSLLVFISLLSGLTHASNKGLYGADNRIDVLQAGKEVLRLSSSVAAMIPNDNFIPYHDGINNLLSSRTLIPRNLISELNLCPKERFSRQPSNANCTGFLIAPTLLATAGHCVDEASECESFRWVFDYQVPHEKSTSVGVIRGENIYSCKRVVDLEFNLSKSIDWAIIELDRPVVNRKALKLSSQMPNFNESLFVIGTPSGLPLKLASGEVRSVHEQFFSANFDTFTANSGSPVFNKSSEVIGILVRGGVDYTHGGSCLVPYSLSDDVGRGEDAQSMTPIINYLNQ